MKNLRLTVSVNRMEPTKILGFRCKQNGAYGNLRLKMFSETGTWSTKVCVRACVCEPSLT